ncbi:4-hydroxy-3-methylbut-2-enyl diphosphate reductase (plasmid) [Streptomyces sp. YIM 121038]|nr:4-hydroxy-3-methylbut-2-enyl diphosphate reductase [Streptomyces sp. YIM 121038]
MATVGVTSGTSVPDVLVNHVLKQLVQHGYTDVETVTAAEDHQRFALLRNLAGPRAPAQPAWIH